MGNISSCHRASNRQSRTPPEDKISRLSPMTEVYGVHIARFIQAIHDRVLVKKKHWGSVVVLDLRFPNTEPERLVAVTAKDPADNKNRKEMLNWLNLVERRACGRPAWEIFWDFVDERFDQNEAELENFKLDLVTMVNRGQLSVDDISTKAEGPDMRLIRFQLQFHDFA